MDKRDEPNSAQQYPSPPPYTEEDTGLSGGVPPGSFPMTHQPHYPPPPIIGHVGNPTLVMSTAIDSPDPKQVICPLCRALVITEVHVKSTTATCIAATFLCFFCCVLAAFLPYCLNCFMEYHHYCPHCKAYIGKYVQ